MLHRQIVVVILAAFTTLGCEEDLPSRADFDKPFTMYGILTPDSDTQSVHVFRPAEFPAAAEVHPEDIDVFSTDLESGERRTWQSKAVEDSLGRNSLIFWSMFRPAPGRTYRIEAVRRTDGATSSADVRIPARPSFYLIEDRAPLLQIVIDGSDIRALNPEVEYVVAGNSGSSAAVRFTTYQGRVDRHERGWSLIVNMIVDYHEIRFILRASNFCRETVALRSLRLHLLVGDSTWDPPGGVFDPYVLAQPDRMSNVENGYGFVGGGFQVEQTLFPSRETVEAACFIYSL